MMTSSGGTLPTASGGQATGGALGIIDVLAPPAPCDNPDLELDPPCNDDDVHGVLVVCAGVKAVAFNFPLTSVVPPAENLRLVCLPVDASLGAGGVGGLGGLGGSAGLADSGPALGAESLTPETAGELATDGSFTIVEPAESVFSRIDVKGGWPSNCLGPGDANAGLYAVAQIALTRGDSIVVQRRLLVDGAYPCTL